MSTRGDGTERPPAWEFTVAETKVLCTCLRACRYPSENWRKVMPDTDKIDQVLDRLFGYLATRERWERLFLAPQDELPF